MAKKQRSKRRRSRSTASRAPWILGAIGVAALIAIPIVVDSVRAANLPGERFASQGNRHVPLGANVPPYNSDPPTSGPHTAELAAWGAYGPDDVVEDQRVLHNMEDGGVVFWYRPVADEDETLDRVDALEEIAAGYRRVVIAPRPDMPTDYAMTAWRRLQRFETIDEEGMTAFLAAYEGIDNHVR
ncbi:MAG: DUF3105 domain-containing protein [Trueperaceae bacterium]|nr:DUF3105 domain-containing protein [Trueperaceae bacterium]